jgi:hypothetical protein
MKEDGAVRIAKRLRQSGALVVAGLAVEVVSLQWTHPTAFLFFALGGGVLIVGGMLLYLWSLVPARTS